MQRRATTTIQVDDGLIMRPANTTYTNNLLEAFEETWPEVSRAMPWILPEKEIEPQLADFLEETERTGRVGRMHHWVLIRPWDEAVLGLLGFDRVTRSGIAEWNLGYWVRSSEQRRGIASRAIEAALTWLAELEPVSVELKVDPKNAAGCKCAGKAQSNEARERTSSRLQVSCKHTRARLQKEFKLQAR